MLANSHDESKMNAFPCGNKITLQKEGIREAMLEFYKKWYSANIMKLVMLSKDPLDKMEENANKMFSDVKNFDIEVPDLS